MTTIVAEYAPQDKRLIGRSAQEKVAIVLAALDNTLAVELLKKLGADDAKQILESTVELGPLTFKDVQPLVDEFAQEFAEALGISASRDQLMALLEAAFTSDEIANFLGSKGDRPSEFSWQRFTIGMEVLLVPYLLDENPQAGSVVLSKVNPELAARCLEQLPATLRASMTARMLNIGELKKPVMEILEKVLQEDLFGEKKTEDGSARLERLSTIINKLDRDQAYEVINDIMKISPEDGARLRKLIFMFEDVVLMLPNHRAKLLDRISTDVLIAALFGVEAALKETFLQSLSARTRRMVESELPAGESQPRKDTQQSRRKIAELALQLAKSGDLELPDPDAAPQPGAAA